jgi:hypothetical protein
MAPTQTTNGAQRAPADEEREAQQVAAQLDPSRRGKLSIAQRQELASKLMAYNTKDETFFQKLATKARGKGGRHSWSLWPFPGPI